MATTDDDQKPREQEPNWVDKWTFYVLTATLIVVSIYTYETHKQVSLTRQLLEMDSRPYIEASFEARTLPFPQAGQKFNFIVLVGNSGKTPVKVHVRSTAMFSLDNIPAPDLPSDGVLRMIWPSPYHTRVRGESENEITEGQIKDMENGRGWMYLRTYITYGSYHSAVCSKLAAVPVPNQTPPFRLGDWEVCDDPKSNDAS